MNGKSALGSMTMVGASVVILAQLAQIAGYTLSPEDQTALSNMISGTIMLISTAASLIGGGMAIWGRLKASHAQPITSVMPKDGG